MNIICAYCHIKGHHIKACEELAEKNRRVKPQTIKTVVEVSKPVPPKLEMNRFLNLYSSDEEEDGEIVEDRTEFRKRALEECVVDEEDVPSSKWARSGLKSIVIKMPQIEPVHYNEPSEVIIASESSIMDYYYFNKYKGMSWVEIEYASD